MTAFSQRVPERSRHFCILLKKVFAISVFSVYNNRKTFLGIRLGFTQRQIGNLSNFRSLRTRISSHCDKVAHTGVAISRIEVPFFDNTKADSVKWYKKNGLYDDRIPRIRWRFPHQCEHWFGMTVLFDTLLSSTNSNLSVYCIRPMCIF